MLVGRRISHLENLKVLTLALAWVYYFQGIANQQAWRQSAYVMFHESEFISEWVIRALKKTLLRWTI